MNDETCRFRKVETGTRTFISYIKTRQRNLTRRKFVLVNKVVCFEFYRIFARFRIEIEIRPTVAYSCTKKEENCE